MHRGNTHTLYGVKSCVARYLRGVVAAVDPRDAARDVDDARVLDVVHGLVDEPARVLHLWAEKAEAPRLGRFIGVFYGV